MEKNGRCLELLELHQVKAREARKTSVLEVGMGLSRPSSERPRVPKQALKAHAERNRITLWMKKIMKNNKSLSDLRLRNEFLEYLAVVVQDGELQPPFNQDPPRAALKILARHLPGRDESSTQDDESMAMLRFLPAKHGGFLLPKPLPQIGAYCYIAASGQMECKKD